MNGRNYEQLILLAPGVQPVNTGAQGSFYGRAPTYSISGSRTVGQEELLDGANIQGFWGHGSGNSIIGTSLGVEAIGEFQVLTGTYSARFGGSGSVLNATTRSGTNEIHGTVYEFLRNSAMDALNFFDDPASPPTFRGNQFGASLGGPIRKNKSFFFVNYEGLRQRLGLTSISSVPDANTHQGLLPCNTVSSPLPCVNGLVDIGVASSVQPIMDLFPKPNAGVLGNGLGLYRTVLNEPASEDFLTTRWDYYLSENNNLFVRYILDNGTLTDPTVAGYGLYPEISKGRNQYATIGDKMVLSSTLVNQATFSFVRTPLQAFTTASHPALNFFPGENRQDGTIMAGGLFIGGSSFTPNLSVQNGFAASDDATWVRGRHSIQFGLTVRRLQDNHYDSFFSNGSYTFPTLQTFLEGQPAIFIGALPDRANSYRGFRETDITPYIQDDWKATRRLTLNLGLRYEFVTNPTEVKGLLYAFVNPTQDPDFTHVSNVFQTNPTTKNFAPRLGLAWDPFDDHKTVFRAGAGIFYDLITVRNYMPAFLFAGPYQVGLQIQPSFPVPFQGGAIPLIIIGEAMTYNPEHTPYVAQYNFNVQRELPGGIVLSVAYVGSRGENLLVPQENNPIVPTMVGGRLSYGGPDPGSTPPGTAGPRENPNPFIGSLLFSKTTGWSAYHALQVYAHGDIARRLRLQLSYTYSHCIDIFSESYGLEGNQGLYQIEDPHNPLYDKGSCNFDLRHVFTGNFVWRLPFKGNPFVTGWDASLIASAHTGVPFSVADGFDRADLGTNTSSNVRPDLVGNTNNPVTGNINQWFTPSASALQPPGTLGGLGKNNLRGPGFSTLDVALAKTFSLGDRLRLMFRAEAFNLFNHPNFGLPDLVLYSGPACIGGGAGLNCPGPGIPNPDAGAIHNTVTASRQLQMALKLIF